MRLKGVGCAVVLARIVSRIYIYENTDKFQIKILQEVQEIINEFRSDPQTQKDLGQ